MVIPTIFIAEYLIKEQW